MSPTSNALDALRIERPAGPVKQGRTGLGLGVVIVIVVAGTAAMLWARRARSMEVRTAVARAVPGVGAGSSTVLNASGYVTARRRATVSSKATAKVTEILIEEGRKVEAGQILARLDTSNVEVSLRLAEAQLNAARGATQETRALLERAELERQRVRSLAAQKIASQSDLDQAEADAKSLRARLAQQEQQAIVAERQVSVWNQEMEDRIIRAPFAGVVVSKDAQPGEMISPISAGGGFIRTGIGTLVDMNSLEIEVDVNESYLNRVAPEQRVTATLDAYPDWPIPARVIAIIPSADRQKATVKVRIGFEKLDPRILPDMGIKVAFRGEDAPATHGEGVLVPAAALRQQDGRDVVWVVRDQRLERRAVRVPKGNSSGDVAVQAGLAAGERVMIESSREPQEGARVREKKS